MFRVIEGYYCYKTNWRETKEEAIQEAIDFFRDWEDFQEDYEANCEEGETFDEFWKKNILEGANFFYLDEV